MERNGMKREKEEKMLPLWSLLHRTLSVQRKDELFSEVMMTSSAQEVLVGKIILRLIALSSSLNLSVYASFLKSQFIPHHKTICHPFSVTFFFPFIPILYYLLIPEFNLLINFIHTKA